MITYKQFILENEENSEEIHYPGGVYISVKMTEESSIALQKYMDKYLPDKNHNKKQHCTLIYSKKEQKEEVPSNNYTAIGTFLRFSKFGKEGEILVAELNCETLVNRNRELVKKYGFISDFDKYKPHFTLIYDAKEVDINSLPEIDFAINFENETVEQLDDNWSSNKEDSSETLVRKAMDARDKKE